MCARVCPRVPARVCRRAAHWELLCRPGLSLHPVPVWAEVSWGNGLGAPPSWTCKRYTQGAQVGGQAEK